MAAARPTDLAEHPGSGSSGEAVSERLDRELGELMQELRVILPGVQVLFAFLLTVPFASRFARIGALDRALYLSAFLAAAAASVCLIAPSVNHRLRWRRRDKERLLRSANRLAIAGTGLLAVAIGATVYLVSDFVYEGTVAAVTTGTIVGGLVVLWYVVPLVLHLRSHRAGVSP